jgi:hypothetical protein
MRAIRTKVHKERNRMRKRHSLESNSCHHLQIEDNEHQRPANSQWDWIEAVKEAQRCLSKCCVQNQRSAQSHNIYSGFRSL